MQSLRYCFWRKTEHGVPIGSKSCFAIKSYQPIASCVPQLFKLGGPPAIFFAIPLIVIDSLNRMFWRWLLSHVCKKRLERNAPSIADKYAASAVMAIIGVCWIVTTLDHAVPCVVLSSSGHPMNRCGVSKQTSATSCMASFQVASSNIDAFPAFTNASPEGELLVYAGEPDNLQTSEGFSDKIFKTMMRWQLGVHAHNCTKKTRS